MNEEVAMPHLLKKQLVATPIDGEFAERDATWYNKLALQQLESLSIMPLNERYMHGHSKPSLGLGKGKKENKTKSSSSFLDCCVSRTKEDGTVPVDADARDERFSSLSPQDEADDDTK